ncbi:solute carrier family 25 member 44-like isoform X2 [Dysidea avara]|uniref:solute carrier family 25 member 44-like isoform X2 n=1 Tax=Dysidea avara TaxID=196820 RepID=UPI003324636E
MVTVVADNSAREIEWKDLDKLKFFTIAPSLFIGVRFLVYPFNLIKTRLFMQSRKSMYTGTLDAFHQVLKHEGVSGLYKGFVASSFSILSGQLYITSYQLVRAWMEGYRSEVKGFVGGFCASVIGQTATVPSDVIAQRLMMQGQVGRSTVLHNTAATAKHIKLKGTVAITKEIYLKEGLLGFYRGYWISLVTYAPNSALWWGFYSAFFNLAVDYKLQNSLPLPLIYAFSGISAGVSSAVLTNPLDVLRTRYQVSENGLCLKYRQHLRGQ